MAHGAPTLLARDLAQFGEKVHSFRQVHSGVRTVLRCFALSRISRTTITGERGKERPVCINCRYQKVKKVNFLVTEGEEGQEHGDHYLFLKSLGTAYLFSFLVL